MKRLFYFRILLAFLLVGAPLGAVADTFFTDDFSNGSTLDALSAPGGTTNASLTSYDLASSKNATSSTIGPGLLSGKLGGNTTSGYWEAQALFTTNPVVMVAPGDYVDLTIVFTNSAGTLLNGTASQLWIGLYDSDAAPGTTNPPVDGALANSGLNKNSGSAYATGNCQLWAGYLGQVLSGNTSYIVTRPVQNGTGTTSANQELLGDGRSGGTFNNPTGTRLASVAAPAIAMDTTSPYTLELQIMLDPGGSGDLIISNALYSGAGTGGTLLMSNIATTSSPIANAFDGLAFGAFNSSSVGANPQMDVSSITITGHTTIVTAPPTITSQPVSVTAPVGAFVPFMVSATGFNMTYQWHRNGTNLVDGGNISGANSPTLIISPVSAADASSTYYVTITGAGDYSTNSSMTSLTIGTATPLTWSGNAGNWDLNQTADWLTPGSSLTTFNYGDPVTFDDTGVAANPVVSLNYQYLSAGSVTVNASSGYVFTGSGSFAGPGALNYIGAGGLEIDNANTYTGGTVISNAAADLYLNNLNGLGTGPLTLAKAGGVLEAVPPGGASYGLQGDINVADDFIIYFESDGSYAGVMFGNLSGTTGKTLTLEPNPSINPASTNRYRVYGSSTVYNGNLAIDPNDPPVANANYSGSTLAPYTGGTQTYNGVISGNGGIVQRGGGETILNGANTYTGGTTPTTGSIGLGIDSTGNPVTAGPLGTGPLYLAPELPNTTGKGTILAAGGARTIYNPIEYPSATNNLTLAIGGSNNLTLAGPFSLNGNDGLGTQTTRTIEVDNTGLTTISGVISGTGFNLTKTGKGVLDLDNTETYSGTTTVSAGLLGGTGTIVGPVSATGGGVAPGDNGIGTLIINNSLTLGTGSSNVFEVNQAAGTHDQATVSGAVTYGGTLYATNLSGTLSTGDSFTLFSAGSQSGNFTTIAGSPGAGLAWSFDPTNGVLSVVGGVATNPTNITVSVTSGNLNLSWPGDHLGWTLQTNSVGLTATNMWFAYPGSTSVTNETIPVSTTETNVFYRLIYTP